MSDVIIPYHSQPTLVHLKSRLHHTRTSAAKLWNHPKLGGLIQTFYVGINGDGFVLLATPRSTNESEFRSDSCLLHAEVIDCWLGRPGL